MYKHTHQPRYTPDLKLTAAQLFLVVPS